GSDRWGGDNTNPVLDLAAGKELAPRDAHGAPIGAIAIPPDGNTVATAGQDAAGRLGETTAGPGVARLQACRGQRPHVSFSSDGSRLISFVGWGTDGVLQIWDARTHRLLDRVKLSGADAVWETISADGKTAVSVEQKARRVRLHDLTTGKVTKEGPDDGHPPSALAPKGDKFVALQGGLMTVADRKQLGHIDTFHAINLSARFSADGRRLLVGVLRPKLYALDANDPTVDEVAIVDAIEGKELRRVGMKEGNRYAIRAVALSGDGKTAVSIRDSDEKPDEQLITLWETETGRERGHFLGHRGQAKALAISADGRFVVSGGSDTAALVWDATRPRRWGSSTRQESAADLAARFKDLIVDDAEQAYAAIWALIS